MFYLIKFFNIFKNHPTLSIIFSSLTLILFVMSALFHEIDKKIFIQLAPRAEGSYFFALVEEETYYKEAIEKIKDLPGVEYVDISHMNDVRKDVRELLHDMQIFERRTFQIVPLKIGLMFGISETSKELILKYLIRLVGKDNIFTGHIVKEVMEEDQKLQFVSRWGMTISFICIVVLWLFSSYLFSKKIQQYSFVIDTFQRKKRAGIKILSMGLLFIQGLVLLLLLYFFNNLNSILMIIIFIFSNISMIFYSMSHKWQE